MKTLNNILLNHWKTSACGFAACVFALAGLYFQLLTPDTAAGLLVSGIGLLLAKDAGTQDHPTENA